MKTIRDIEQAIRQMQFRTDKQTDEHILSEALQEMDRIADSAAVKAAGGQASWKSRLILRTGWYRAAVAAAVILAALGLVVWFNNPDGIGSSNKGTAITDNGLPGKRLVPLVTSIPEKLFAFMPRNFNVPNLEPPDSRPRPLFYVPEGSRNVAHGKTVTSSDREPIIGDLAMITDGDKSGKDGSFVELGPGKQYITVDLQGKYNIYAVIVWHYHKYPRIYKDVVVQVADNSNFKSGVVTLFNNDFDNSLGLGKGKDKNYVETNAGKLIDGKGVSGRYIRLYSNGNNINDLNHYIEVEIFALPEDGGGPVSRPTPHPKRRPPFMGTPSN